MNTSIFSVRCLFRRNASAALPESGSRGGTLLRRRFKVALLNAVSVLAAGAFPVCAQTVDSVITNRLSEPYGVATDANVYYLTDSANHRIVKFVPDTGSLRPSRDSPAASAASMEKACMPGFSVRAVSCRFHSAAAW